MGMVKKVLNVVASSLFLVIVAIMAGCGGGGGAGAASNASILISSTLTSVPAGSSFPVTITISGDFPTLSGIDSEVESDNPSVIPKVSASKSTAGSAGANVTVNNISTIAQTVRIRAKIKDSSVTSPWIALTVQPATLELSPPVDASVTFISDTTTKLCASVGSIYRYVVSGANVTFKNPSGIPVYNQPVTITVTSISNFSGVEQVTFWPGGTNQTIMPPFGTTLTMNTDTNGIYYWPVAIDGYVPVSQNAVNTFVVNWRVTTTSSGTNNVPLFYDVTGQTLVTAKCS